MSARRTGTAVIAAGLSVVVLTGCGFRGASSIPLPGGQGQGDDAYSLTIEFQDVLDLVPQSAVKVDDVTVGSVKSVDVDGYTARIVVNVNPDVVLPANTTAALRQTSLLGEKFVSLDQPVEERPSGRLRGGETIGLERTTASAEIEEVLGALSLVLNGGSLEQLQVINKEIVLALEGREDKVKSALNQLELFVGGLDQQKGQIVRALDSLDRLSARLAGERQIIATALEDIPAGVEVLTDQREELTRVLTELDELGEVSVRVINASKANTVADLRALQPILGNLANAGEDLPRSLELLTTYPFPRTVTDGIKGDFANLFATADVNLVQLLNAEGVDTGALGGAAAAQAPAPQPAVRAPVPAVPVPVPPVPAVPGGPGLPAPPAVDVPGVVTPSPTVTPTAPPAPGGNPLLNGDTGGLLRLLIGGLT